MKEIKPPKTITFDADRVTHNDNTRNTACYALAEVWRHRLELEAYRGLRQHEYPPPSHPLYTHIIRARRGSGAGACAALGRWCCAPQTLFCL